MASATFNGDRALRPRRATAATGIGRPRPRGTTGATGAPCARRRVDPGRRRGRDPGAFLRGIGASLLIAVSYAAVVSGLRWLLAA